MSDPAAEAVDALAFLRALHDGAPGFLELRCIHPSKDKSLTRIVYRPLPLAALPALPVDTHNVYFGACPRTRKQGDGSAVAVATCLWLDVDYKAFPDGEAGAARLRKALGGLAPSAVVATGHGEHWYWLLREGVPVGEACAVMEALRMAVNPKLDKVNDPPRILRVPGTFNLKDGGKLPVRVAHWEPGRRFNLSDFDVLTEAEEEGRDHREHRAYTSQGGTARCAQEAGRVPNPGGGAPEGGSPDRSTESTEAQTPASGRMPPGMSSLCTPGLTLSSLCTGVLSAIEKALPSKMGDRERKTFVLARALKAIPDVAGRSVGELVPVVREWYRRVQETVGTEDYPLSEALASFAHAWGRVRVPLGVAFMQQAIERARVAPVPAAVQGLGAEVELLARLCVELARTQRDGVFWLGCRPAGALLGGVAFEKVNKMLHLLEDIGFLEVVKRGTNLKTVKPGEQPKATRYRLGPAAGIVAEGPGCQEQGSK